MLEFYLKYYPLKVKQKAKKLAEELLFILAAENMTLQEASEPGIDCVYKKLLKKGLYTELSNIYYTIRQNNGGQHNLLNKYLPELKKEPAGELLFADFFCGAGGLSQGMINAGFSPAFVNDNYVDALETYYFNHFLSLDCFYNTDIQCIAENIETYKHLFNGVKVIAGGN